MKFKPMPFFCVAVAACAVHAGSVRMAEDSIVLPTYAPGGYDKTPLFYTGRVYQGAQGRVYPYPMQDVLHDEKVDETYKYLTLENDWLQMGLLPEHGGHLLSLVNSSEFKETTASCVDAERIVGFQTIIVNVSHQVVNLVNFQCPFVQRKVISISKPLAIPRITKILLFEVPPGLPYTTL